MRHDPSFLKAICEDLDADGPRLVYSDWLLEKGARYGEFIAASCALAAAEAGISYGACSGLRLTGSEPPEVLQLRARANRIWRKNRKDWEPAELAGARIEWHRGFIDHLTLDAAQLALPILDLAPAVTSLAISVRPEELARALRLPILRQIRFLNLIEDVRATPLPSTESTTLALEETTAPLRTFVFRGTSPSLTTLLKERLFDRIEELSLGSSMIRGPSAALALETLRAPLARLNVAHVPLCSEGWTRLIARGTVDRLEVLNACDSGLDDETTARLLAQFGIDARARAIDLSGNMLGPHSVDALVQAAGSTLRHLEHLDLRGSLRAALVPPLTEAFGARALV